MSATFGLASQYVELSDAETTDRIHEHKARLGEKLVILSHHYQRLENVALADFVGDSYELSRRAAEQERCEHILFCGVHFMAESARVLARPRQKVYLPNLAAGCPMADMARRGEVEEAWDELALCQPREAIIPMTYMNSDADLKAFCGRNGGIVCTSSNAKGAFHWAFERGRAIFFFPDEHLGRNTANAYGITRDEIAVWDPKEESGGLSADELTRARVILWKGYCHVHTFFQVSHINQMRDKYPGCKVIVHPECTEEVVAAADANGSTSFIVKFVAEAGAGSTTVIGTEVNLTHRLAVMHPDRRVLPLARSLCPNMYKTSLRDMLACLDHLGEVDEVIVPPDTTEDARKALQRMLAVNN